MRMLYLYSKMPDDIFAMVNALEALERVDISARNRMYRHVRQSILNYLEQLCEHHIVTDLIDIDPDRSQTIRYCKYCRRTFD